MVSFKKLSTALIPFTGKKLTNADVEFIREYLNKQEQIVFYRMQYFDQRHSLDVAYNIKDISKHRPKIYQQKMIKAALLHDVGKVYFKWNTWYRITTYLMFKFLKPIANFIAGRKISAKAFRFIRALHNKKHHAQLAEELLRDIKIETDVLELIKQHHSDDLENESLEVAVLKESDKRN